MNFADTREIIVSEIFPHTPETIWKALTSGELMAQWLKMPSQGFEPVIGKRFTFQTKPAGAWDGFIHCEILQIIPLQLLAYSWKGGDESNVGYGAPLDTIVTFTLLQVERGTRLQVVHSGFVIPTNQPAFSNMSEGWKKVVPNIGAIANEQISSNQSN